MKIKYPHVEEAHQYAVDVVSGVKLANKYEVAACQRFLDDIDRITDKEFEYRFDVREANKRCKYVENFKHIKGKWAGSPLRLEAWQKFIICNVFGWKHKKTGYRRFRTVYIEVPRKNAKSTLSSAVGILCMATENEGGAEVYSAATTRDQAKIVFNDAQGMVRGNPSFQKHFGVRALSRSITQLHTSSKFEPLSADANTLDGLNTHVAIIDELHAHKNRKVFDVMETSTGARTQSIMWLITTAGFDRAGICYEQRRYAAKILDGNQEDETYFAIIYTVDDEDMQDMDRLLSDPVLWQKANPNYGVSVLPEDIKRLAAKARALPSAQNNFLTKRLNVWVNAGVAWMNMVKWQMCRDPEIVWEDFEGHEAIAAFDLASKTDFAARALLFQRVIDGEFHYYVKMSYYLPEVTVYNSSNSQYEGWAQEGLITLTPGDIIDFTQIEDDLQEDAIRYDLIECPYDPFQATQFATRMMAEGLPMVEVRQVIKNFSEPMKELEALVLDKRLHHDGDPILEWMMSNVVAYTDPKDNIYPTKETKENKIDGPVALIMALGSYLRSEEEEPSVYENRGVLVI